MDLEVARNFLIALLLGALVGVERERKKAAEPARSFGGIRTHILLALAGAASARLSALLAMPWLFAATLLVVGAALLASYLHVNRDHDDAHGLTSEIAALVVFLLGAMVVVGEVELAVALGVATSAVLAFKQPLHGLVRRIDTPDLYAALKLLIASFIVLPLLPDATVDPWDAINPYKLWLLVVLISALSLAGYVAVRWLGSAHGTALTGLAGGLVSSTATTLGFARSSRDAGDGGDGGDALAAGILLAWLVMFARMLVLVAVVNRSLLASAWLPIVAMGAATAAFAGWHYRAGLADTRSRAAARDVPVSNPFSLTAAVKFGALFAVVLLLVKIAEQQFSGVGVYVVAALAGSVDVDAITLSMADSARDGAAAQAGAAIAVAAVANTVVKCGLVLALGAGRVRRHVALASGVVVVVGLVGAAVV